MASGGDVLSSEYLHFALTVLAAACSVVFSIVSWLIRIELKRAVADYTRIATDLKQLSKDHAEFREWTRFILAIAGIISSDGLPTGRRLPDKYS